MIRIGCFVLVLLVGPVACAVPPLFVVDDFDDGVQNHLLGYRNPFFAEPSSASASRVSHERMGASGRSVRIESQRMPDGFCGYWIHLFDMRSAEPRFFDARGYVCLSFWMKRETGSTPLLVKIADSTWIDKQDSVPIGFADTDKIGKWQEVTIQIGRDHRIDWSQLGGITFEFAKPGKQVVYIDDITLKTSPTVRTPRTRPARVVHRSNVRPRKLWVWSTADVLSDEHSRLDLLSFCSQHNVDEVWMQVLYDLERDPIGKRPTRCILRDEDALTRLLVAASARGVKIHALDGYPEFCLRGEHDIPLAVVDAVIRFNEVRPPEARFAGVHFDNEPYLLIGWQDPARRRQILTEFLELNVECQRRIRTHSRMEFGIDIPFWWQERDERTNEVIGEVEFRGNRQAASYHCIELLDNVGVMNYRDTADGADGMIAHGRDLLRFADQQDRGCVYMGVETFRYQKVSVRFAVGLPRDDFLRALNGPARGLAKLSRLNKFRLRTLDDGVYVHVGIEVPRGMDDGRTQLALRTLANIAGRLGLSGDDDLAEIRKRVQKKVAADAEWSGLHIRDVMETERGNLVPGFELQSTMLGKTTFADESVQYFDEQIQAADSYFGRYRNYGGIAIHYYKTFKAKVAGEE